MAAAKAVKKTGKENAPVVKSKKLSDERVAGDDELADDNGKTTSRSGDGSLQKRLDTMTAERDRLRTQRDTYSKQFDELSTLRSSQPEQLFESYKQKAEARSTAQNDVITSLTTLNDRLQARIQALEKAAKADLPAAGGVFGEKEKVAEPAKADPKEVKALKDRMAKLESELKNKGKEYDQLDRMYKDEVEASRKLLASRSGAPAVPSIAESGSGKEESVKDAAIIRMYEDMYDLCILEVRIKDGKFGPKDKEYVFSCVQTVDKKHSAAFKLRQYTTIDQSLVASKASNPYVKAFDFTPNFAGEADAALLKRLEDYAQPFSAPMSQLGEMLESFRAAMAEESDE